MQYLAEILALASAGLIPLYINLPILDDEDVERAMDQEHGA